MLVGLVGGRQAGRDSYWVLTRMMTMNYKLLFVVSGCHACLPAGAGEVVLGGCSCMLEWVVDSWCA